MAMTPEQRAWLELRRALPKPGDRIMRVENLAHDGTPDVNYCADGVELWIELKAPRLPVRKTTPLFGSSHPLTIAQRNWFLAQGTAQGLGIVMIRTKLWWAATTQTETLNSMTPTQVLESAAWASTRPVGAKDWESLRQLIVSKRLWENLRLPAAKMK